MKPVEVAQVKSEDLHQKLFADLKMEAHQIQEKVNMMGALDSSAVGVQIRVASLNKMKELQQQMINFYVEALGHKLDQPTTKNSIAQKVGMFFEQCKITYFSPESQRPATAQNLAAFETEAEQLLHHLDRELQIAVDETKNRAGLITFLCPNCHAEIQAAEGTSERFTACPSCREEVHFRHKLHLKGSDKAAPAC